MVETGIPDKNNTARRQEEREQQVATLPRSYAQGGVLSPVSRALRLEILGSPLTSGHGETA